MFESWIKGDEETHVSPAVICQRWCCIQCTTPHYHIIAQITASPRRSRKRKTKSSHFQAPVEGDGLAVLSTLAGALHSEPGIHPLDSLTMSMSDQHFCDALEGSFELAIAADSLAARCSLRAVQVLLSRLHAYWKVS